MMIASGNDDMNGNKQPIQWQIENIEYAPHLAREKKEAREKVI